MAFLFAFRRSALPKYMILLDLVMCSTWCGCSLPWKLLYNHADESPSIGYLLSHSWLFINFLLKCFLYFFLFLFALSLQSGRTWDDDGAPAAVRIAFWLTRFGRWLSWCWLNPASFWAINLWCKVWFFMYIITYQSFSSTFLQFNFEGGFLYLSGFSAMRFQLSSSSTAEERHILP